MKFNATQIPYRSTGLFSALINDYIETKGKAQSFVNYTQNIEGYKKAIDQRASFPTNRKVLVEVLQNQYTQLEKEGSVSNVQNNNNSNNSNNNRLLNSLDNKVAFTLVNDNVNLLLKENTFTVNTAHQPNIFTGPLYFLYKIVHAIQLAAELKKQFPQHNFVPIYYMGSEDADLQEVGSYTLAGEAYQWNTKQKGAIGRMKVDDELIKLLQNLEGYWLVQPAGKEALEILKQAYQKEKTISEATLALVHAYFGKYGLVVIQPDNTNLKSLFIDVMEKELRTGFSQKAIQSTKEKLASSYHVQSDGRDVNLFYLKENIRARIEKQGASYIVVDTDIHFTEEEIVKELHAHPDRFSPNVILRGVYQETILPGIAFIGGGGELAYWMELKNVFTEVKVHYPILQLRNSFMFMNEKQTAHWNSLGFALEEIFKPMLELELDYVKNQTKENLALTNHIASLNDLYTSIQQDVIKIDTSLGDHAKNLSVQAQKKLALLEKKMIRAEKRKQKTSIDRIQAIKGSLFPKNSVQERVDNFSVWVGAYGWDWVEAVLENSTTLNPCFTIITITKD
ncbi:MAG: bacillithiol biosynthesis cysteine-adding enzyme BshC [Chitinophagaceae bacterium]|nr:MAG: bacillithiol biosynthesis cysteine-adding enzyme BshC [Chitinophagaceae bacterium]